MFLFWQPVGFLLNLIFILNFRFLLWFMLCSIFDFEFCFRFEFVLACPCFHRIPTLVKHVILSLFLECCSKQKRELLSYMKCSDLKQLKLDESGKIGYTFKTLGSGFWALKQNDFRKAITKIVLQVHMLIVC